MKKLLILAYDFPPYVSVGGLRPYAWYNYLKEFGVEPIVITRQFENHYQDERDYIAPSKTNDVIVETTEKGTIICCPYRPTLANRLYLKFGAQKYRFVRRAITAYYELAQYWFLTGSKKDIYYAAKNYLKENKVDAIIATGGPFVLFAYASRLSKEFDIPWIADYRDPWSQNKNRSTNFFLSKYYAFSERHWLKNVTAITTVSDFLKLTIQPLLPEVPMRIFPNGYDPALVEMHLTKPQNSTALRIAFVGTIYNWHPWKSFLQVMNQWKKEHPEAAIELHFYGINIPDEVKEYFESECHAITKTITIFPKIPNKELMEQLFQSNVLLLFNDYSIIGTKIFDYLAIRRKMILCYENDTKAKQLKERYYTIEEHPKCSQRLQAELIEQTNSGVVVQDEVHLVQVLNELYAEFLKTGTIQCDSVGVENYSRKLQVEQLAALVNELT